MTADEARDIYAKSKMTVVFDEKNEYLRLQYIEFQEMLCRATKIRFGEKLKASKFHVQLGSVLDAVLQPLGIQRVNPDVAVEKYSDTSPMS